MASTARTQTDRVAWLRTLAERPFAFDFHQALRRLECTFRELPRWGDALRPSEEPVRLGQDASVAFAPSALSSFRLPADGRAGRLAVAFFGLFGPHGPLPLHITEYARDRLRNVGDPTFTAFADLFHHRLLVLFHRAWAAARPTVAQDRPKANRFASYVGALSGLGLPSFLDRDSLPDRVKLHFAAWLATASRPAEGLEAMVASYFGVPARLEEFVGEWLELPEPVRFRLGYSPEVSTLGRTTVLGRRVFDRSHKFRVVLGPLPQRQFSRFLPGGASLTQLSDLVRAYVGDQFAWDVRLIPAPDATVPLRLSREGRLGYNARLGRRGALGHTADVIVDPISKQTERTVSSDVGRAVMRGGVPDV